MAAPKFVKRPTGTTPTSAAELATKEYVDTGGTWVPFTPAWEADGTDPAIGNGNIVGRYCVVGKRMDVIIKTTMGSTTTYGGAASPWYWVMNFPATVITGLTWIGHYLALDAAGASTPYKTGTCIVDTGFSAYVLRCIDPAGSYFHATNPQTWAVNDYVVLRATLEIQ